MIKHYVKSKNLEAELVFKIVRLTRSKSMMKGTLACDYCLDNQIVDLVLESTYRCSMLFKVPIYLLKTSLVAGPRISAAASRAAILGLVLNVFPADLINTVVCEMLKQVFDITVLRTLIWIGCKAGHAIIKEVDSERMDTIQKYIES